MEFDSPLNPFERWHGITVGQALEGGGTEERSGGEAVRAS